MNLINCPRCGKVFMKVKSPICPECQRQEEELFEKVVAYIKENKDATVAEVATALECEVEVIDKFIKSGRLSTVKPSWQTHCRQCGIPISSGEMCEGCRLQLASEISKTLPEKKKPAMEVGESKKANKVYLIDRVMDK